MTVVVNCPECQKSYRVSADRLDRRARCSHCGSTFTLSTVTGNVDGPADRSGVESTNASSPPRLPQVAQRPATQVETGSAGTGNGRLGEQAEPDAHALPAGKSLPKKLGRYAIRRRLGSGGMGVVYLAHDTSLDRMVAVKALRAELSRDDQFRQRFLREARLTAKLHNPHAVTVYDMGEADGVVFLAMEYVDGGCLETAVVSSGPLDWPEATRAVRDAARGLAAAHRLGLVHRDVKPANLLRTGDGVTKVADFGLARAQAFQTQLTQAGAWMGTPAYMAPEQWRGDEADARSDLYALICTWYFLLTARPPYEGDSLASLGYLHTHDPFPDPRHMVPGIPDAIVGLMVRGAAKSPADRLTDADSLAVELEALLDTAGKPAKTASPVVAAAQSSDRIPQTPAKPQVSPSPLPREHTLIEVPPTPLQPTLISPAASLSSEPLTAAQRIHPGHLLVRAIRRVDDMLAVVAGEHNTVLHGFLRAASVTAVLLLLVLLSWVPFAGSSAEKTPTNVDLPLEVANQPSDRVQPAVDPVDDPALASVGADDSPEATVDSLLERGWAAFVKRDYDQAIEDYSEAIRLQPDHARAFAHRGWVHERRESYEPAIVDLYETIRLTPEDALAYAIRGHAWGAMGDHDRAMTDYKRAVQTRPTDAHGFLGRAFAWFSLGEYDRAIEDYDEAIRLDLKAALVFAFRGFAWFRKGEYDRAIEDYDEAIRLDPKWVHTYVGRADVLTEKQEYDRAIEDLNEAIRLDPKLAVAYHGRADVLAYKQEYDRAIEDYDEAIRLDPKVAAAFNDRAVALVQKQEYDRAIEDYDKAIRLAPQVAMQYLNRSFPWFRKGEYDRAIEDCDESIRLDPKWAEAYFWRARFLAYKQEYDRAIEDLNEAIRLDPKNAAAYDSRGDAWYIKGEYDRAIEDLNEAIRLDPKIAVAYHNRGRAWFYKGWYYLAIKDYDEAIRLDPKVAVSYANRGHLKQELGDANGAEADFARARQLGWELP